MSIVTFKIDETDTTVAYFWICPKLALATTVSAAVFHKAGLDSENDRSPNFADLGTTRSFAFSEA